ncbi:MULTISPECIES: TonB-dependent receptor domain-containing protein [unclassified Sphingomonas]|uniref:TonB-dependent receptor n=1 Tax=Novosphingobium rhizosphaerae TaxID=1551649 RepID=UPI0015CE039E
MDRSLIKLMAGAACLWGMAGHAEEAPADGSGSVPTGDIIVTANRVASSAQKTPIALTVYNGDQLAAAGVTSVSALQRIDPSVNFTARNGTGYVAVRGIASTDVTEIGDPSVPIARDGFFTNRSYSINTSMYDLQRVEVLKGPQGTLFGRNSTGGLISLITRKPGKALGGDVAIEAGNFGAINVDAGVDLPVSDKIQLRFAGISLRHDGYRNLTVLGGRGDDDATLSGRATLAFQPFANFEGLIQYQHDNIDNVGDVALSGAVGTVLTNYDARTFANYVPTSNRLIGNRVRWEFTLSGLPLDSTLTYAGGYDAQDWRHKLDASGSATSRATFYQAEAPRTWNHEVRLATPQTNPLAVQVGFFHFQEANTLRNGLRELSGTYAGQDLIAFDYAIKTKSDAVFGQANYRVTEQLHLTAGVRYTHDVKQRTGQSALRCDIAGIPAFVWPFVPCVGTLPTYYGLGNGYVSQSKPTYLAGFDWTPTNTNMVYGKFSTGYKSGGFNSNGSAPSVDYGPENVTAWELGTKNRFLGGAVTFNADVFYQTYTGYQASQATPAVSSGSGVFNVGNAKIYGAEAQLVVARGGLRLDLNGTYLHTRFGSGTAAILTTDPATGGSVSRNVIGNRLPNAPALSVSAGLEYKIDMGGAGSLTPRIDGKYSSDYYFDVFNNADTRQADFAMGNLSLTYAPAAKGLTVTAFVRNFTDKVVFANAQRNFTATPYINAYQFMPPRTYGLRIAYSY